MKKIFIVLTLVSVLSWTLLPSVAWAQNLEESIRGNLQPVQKIYDPQQDIQPGTLQEIIAKIIRQVLAFLATIFIILMLYAGFTWMTAAGDEGKIDKAKSIISAAIIGLAIVLVAYAITVFVANSLLTATGAND